MAEPLTLQARATYRALLRELPRRQLAAPSPLHQRIRQLFRSQEQIPSTTPSTEPPSTSPSSSSLTPLPFSVPTTAEERSLRLQEAEQFAQYARSQRTYATLLDRYNPGMHLDEEERIRLTARRVGLDLPELHKPEDGDGKTPPSGSE